MVESDDSPPCIHSRRNSNRSRPLQKRRDLYMVKISSVSTEIVAGLWVSCTAHGGSHRPAFRGRGGTCFANLYPWPCSHPRNSEPGQAFWKHRGQGIKVPHTATRACSEAKHEPARMRGLVSGDLIYRSQLWSNYSLETGLLILSQK